MRGSKVLFDASSTGEDVASHFAEFVKGKTVLITGANNGLGFETARVLGKHGANVIITTRSAEVGGSTIDKLKALEQGGSFAFVAPLELGSLKSVRSFVKAFLDSGKPLHVLINNAGVMGLPSLERTEDGFEKQLGVNHFAHFLLTLGLMPVLQATGNLLEPARVVCLSSMGHFLFPARTGVRLDDLNFAREGEYTPFTAYGQSKLANVLFAKEITRRYRDKNVIGISLHPGVILGSELMRHTTASTAWSMFKDAWRAGTVSLIFSEKRKSMGQGVSTTVLAAFDPNILPGGYYADTQLAPHERIHPMAENEEHAKAFWELSEQLVAEK